MRRLVLMRHAKSDWSFSEPDHARALNKRGIRSAKALGHWLRTQGVGVDQALISSSTRTRQTWDLLEIDGAPHYDRALYHAEPEAILDALRDAEGQTVLMLGHNPGIAMLAQSLVARPPNHPRFDDYPTGATLVVDFETDSWPDICPGTGKVAQFIVPRDLTG
ncbi:histidine phosphatase family protein [Cognatishimia sp. F0-27]|uniref:SixA phosphatase family protein n=1 Tax=Cognatishimia sp. F0-27 TaxID=2816855 RepID=UPI001D0CB586|nr:histidine phosphatase family protein [Cognatishimia sp. F0-27]MCC1494149.1 histidine phosphatase family protein [Cognatishimia sp. F0-27]